MANRYDDLERKVGIAEYASPHDGFAAVVKARYSDFIVHEVDLNGNIARLDKLETSAPAEAVSTPMQLETKEESNAGDANENSRKRKLSESAADGPSADGDKKESDDNAANKTEVVIDWNSFTESLCKLVGDDTAKEVIAFLQQDEPAEQFYTLPQISDKQVRRSIHQLIKSAEFNSVVRADNHEGRLRVWHKAFFDKMPRDTFVSGSNNPAKRSNKQNKQKKSEWPRDRPNFLQFVLYKENIDTSTAAKDVTRFARLNPKRGISYAGMKDKRGVTTQFCSAFRVEKEQLLAINKRDGVGGGNSSTKGSCIIRVGNLTYSNEEVKLGALAGNRFDIVLRNIDTGDDNHDTTRRKLEVAGEGFKQSGFINYFGMQRFGKSVDTHEVGLQILKGDFEGAVDIIMREKADGDGPRVLEARQTWAKRFDGVNVKEDEAKASEVEAKCARQVEKMCSRFMMCERSIVSSLSRKPRDYKRAFTSISKNMRSMFLHAYQSFLWNKVASFRIKTGGSTEVREGDLVLLEDKSSGETGGRTSGLKGKCVKVVDELDIKEGNRIGDKEISLCGDYRKLMCKPSDVTFAVKEYNDPLQPLINTDLMDLSSTSTEKEEAKKDENVLFGMVIGFTLPPSAYATIALRELTKRPTSSDYQTKLELSGKCERNLI
eukprot:scaffold22971_cov100-Skeletonema_marinoi.AAC.2